MDISSMAGVATVTNTMAGSKTANDTSAASLNQAIDTQAQQAAQQVDQSLTPQQAPQEPSSTRGLPENVGRNINVTA
ncbi:putative motility protein [Marichromatium gracile]|uniref:putative motility protein n=1 Tax=Marichromatium gracile TaxID=1048 RepID=UPI001F27910D|nr:putative motility protein [Marichromatium gracile]MCF1183606.1 putative motility protein [Marichromatium gracile]